MPVFEGTTSGSVLQVAMNIPSKILSGSVTNNTAGSVTINIYVQDSNGNNRRIAPKDNALAAGYTYYIDDNILLLDGSAIHIVTSGSVDYYFSLG